MSLNTLSLKTIANDCFRIDPAGAVTRTASFGGPDLQAEPSVQPSIDPSNTFKMTPGGM